MTSASLLFNILYPDNHRQITGKETEQKKRAKNNSILFSLKLRKRERKRDEKKNP